MSAQYKNYRPNGKTNTCVCYRDNISPPLAAKRHRDKSQVININNANYEKISLLSSKSVHPGISYGIVCITNISTIWRYCKCRMYDCLCSHLLSGDEWASMQNSRHDGLQIFTTVIFVYIIRPLSFIGILCNVLSVFVLGRYDVMQRTTRFLLQNLAIADGMFLVTCLVFVTIMNDEGRLDIIATFLVAPCHLPAVWLVVTVTAERYVAICWPHRASQLCTMSHARQAVAAVYGVWLFMSVLFVIPFVVPRVSEATQITPVVLVYSIFDFFLPLSLLVFFNSCLIKAVRESFAVRRQQVNIRHASNDVKETNNERKCATQLIVVVIVFVVCQLPSSFTIVCLIIGISFLFRSIIRFVSYCLVLNMLLMVVNSSINFFIYFLTGNRFRTTLLDLLCCRRRNQ